MRRVNCLKLVGVVMCVVTDRGDQCLLAWGRWAGRDGTVRRLGYPGCSAEQMAGRVFGADCAVSDVEEMVDRLIVGVLDERKRLVAVFFYVDRLKISDVVEKIKSVGKSRLESSGKCSLSRVSVSAVKDDLAVIRSMVGGVSLWSDKKVVDA